MIALAAIFMLLEGEEEMRDEEEEGEEEEEAAADRTEEWDEEASLMASMGLPLAFASSSEQKRAVGLCLTQLCTRPGANAGLCGYMHTYSKG